MNDLALWMRPGTTVFASTLVDDGEASLAVVLPAGWTSTRDTTGPWTHVTHEKVTLPDSGWKIHVSARLGRLDGVLATATEVLVRQGVAFKYLSSAAMFRAVNAKYAPRASSGKFITVYPTSLEQFDEVSRELSASLPSEDAPSILTDIALDGGALHARYGAFHARRSVHEDGTDGYVMSTPVGDIADTRALQFTIPDGVLVPATVSAALERRELERERRRLPYHISAALHYSNGGGVYDALDDQHRRVAVKEGRRHTGLGVDGVDAASSLEREYAALTALAGIPFIPVVIAWHDAGDRVFLVEQFISGDRAIEFVAQHHPNNRVDASAADRAAYAARVARIIDRVAAVLDDLHERDWLFGDLHPGNMIIGEGDSVTLIDFESAAPVNADNRPFGVATGFSVEGKTGVVADRQRLDLLALWFLRPENAYWEFSDDLLRRTLSRAREEFSTPLTRLNWVDDLAGHRRYGSLIQPVADAADPAETTTRAITDLVTRVRVAAAGGDSVPLGAGALDWALGSGLGGAVLQVADAVGSDRVVSDDYATRVRTSRRLLPGLFTGYAGASLLLHTLERPDDARETLARAIDASSAVTNPDLSRGLAGVALAALAAGEIDSAIAIARRAVQASHWARPGLLTGASGVALVAVRLFEKTGDEEWLDFAESQLAHDRVRLVVREDGMILLDHGNGKHIPSLGHGSLGVAYVASEVAGYRPSPEMEFVRTAAGLTCSARSWATEGLFDGRAGALAFLAATGPRTEREWQSLNAHRLALTSRFVEIDGELNFPGISGLRFSTDLESGMTGALHALRLNPDHPGSAPIPFLKGGALTARTRSFTKREDHG